MDAEAEHDVGSSNDAFCAVTDLDSSKIKKDQHRWNHSASGEAFSH